MGSSLSNIEAILYDAANRNGAAARNEQPRRTSRLGSWCVRRRCALGRRHHARRGQTDQDLARFPHWRQEPVPYPADQDRQTTRSREIALSLDSRPRSGYALPLSRTQRHFAIQIAAPSTTARVRRPPASAACFPGGPAAPRSAAATHRRAYGIPHEPWRAR